MNVVNRLTLRHMLLNKRRTLVTIIGVTLSVSMITAVTTLVASAQDLLIRDAIQNQGNWHARFQDIDAAKAAVFLESDVVDLAMFGRNLGYAQLPGSLNEYKPYLFVQELDAAGLSNLALELIAGRMPARADELVISEHITYNGGVEIEVGDRLVLTLGQRYLDGQLLGQDRPLEEGERLQPEHTREYTVVGIIARPHIEPRSAPGYTVISYLERENLAFGSVDVWITFAKINSSIYKHGQELAAQAEVANYYPDAITGEPQYFVRYNSTLLSLYGVTHNPVLAGVLNSLALVAMVIILIGSVSLIYNAFAISISERTRHMGMMASVGATKAQKRNSVFFEAAVIGVAGIPLGLLAGTVGLGITFYFVSPILTNLFDISVPLRLVVSPVAISIAVLFSVLTIFVSAWIPALRAARIAPIDAIRQTRDVRLSSKVVRTSRLSRWLFGFEAELALKNLKRNRRRYRATVVSLTVSIVLFLTVSGFAKYMGISSNIFRGGANYDVGVFLHNASRQARRDFYARAIELEEVSQYVYEQSVFGSVHVPEAMANIIVRNRDWAKANGGYTYSIWLKSLNDQAFAAYATQAGLSLEDFSSGQPGAIALNWFRHLDGVYVENQVILAQAGTVLPVYLPDQGESQEIIIKAMTKEPPMGTSVWSDPGTLTLIMPESAMDSIVAQHPDVIQGMSAKLFIATSAPNQVEEKLYQLHQESGGEGNLSVFNVAKAAQQEKQFMLLLSVFITGFILLITAICIANIFNTITTSIGIRRREFAMLKSVGMAPRGFSRMIRYESIFYGLKALCFGLPVSLGISYYLYHIISEGFLFPFTLPWPSYGIVILSVFIIVFATMLYSSRRIKKENIIDSLKDENM